jgi:hypothetical protein
MASNELFGKAKRTDAEKFLQRMDGASQQALDAFGEIVGRWDKERKEPFDYAVIGHIAAQFMSFGYFTMKDKHGKEGADIWLAMALGFIETEITRASDVRLRFPFIWESQNKEATASGPEA